MECPKCGHIQADGPPECAKCGLVFAKWVERRSSPPLRPRPSPRPAPREAPEGATASPLGLLLGGTATLFLALAVWHLWLGGGLPTDPGAHVDRAAGYAVAPPPGWVFATPASAEGILERERGRHPEALAGALRRGSAACAFFLPSDPGALAPWGAVYAFDGVPPPLLETERAALAAAAEARLAKNHGEYRMESALLEEVDQLPALRIRGREVVRYLKSPSQEVKAELPGGATYTIGRTEDIWETFEGATDHWLVPGRSKSYLLAFYGPAGAMDRHAPAFDRVVETFRVLDRPPLYGPLATPALRATATVLLLAALAYTLTEAAAALKRR